MEYNTTRDHMVIKEYGRGIQNIVQDLLEVKDEKERQQKAEAVVEIMSILNPASKGVEDYKHKLWDHLFMISDYKLDVKSPYPMPVREVKEERPAPLPYPQKKIKWNHLGHNFEKLYEKALNETDEEKKQGFVQTLALFMRVAYQTWHKENTQEEVIREELKTLSDGKLVLAEGAFKDFVDSGNGPIIKAKNHSHLVNFKRKNNNKKRNSGGHRNSGNRNRKYSKRR